MNICHGNPNDTTRIPQEQSCYTWLDSLHIPYDRIDHAPAFTMEACAEIDAVFGTKMCKNLFLRNSNGSAFYLLLMPGDKPFKTKELSAQIMSTRLSFADENHMREYLDLTPGSVTVMGLANDRENRVQLLIDRDVYEEEYFCCHPCINTSSIRLRTADLLERFLPAVNHTPRLVTLTGCVL
jgi:Ala-tRNA(Pro) deacylase